MTILKIALITASWFAVNTLIVLYFFMLYLVKFRGLRITSMRICNAKRFRFSYKKGNALCASSYELEHWFFGRYYWHNLTVKSI